tara:strand:- start:2668 stop:3603 length:936 start_codon:yes stop_codon:yes gene_type:complete
MAEIKYSTLISTGTNPGLRLDKMIENEVRALLFDAASIRNSGALLFAGDIAGSGSAALSLRYAGLDGFEPMNTAADGTEISNTNLTSATADITIGRIGLRYDLTDLAALTKLGNDIDIFRLAGSMAGAFESRFMEMICALFSSATSSAGTTGVDMSVDDFMDALYLLEIANNPSQLFAVLHPRQIADLQSSIRNETANAIAFNPAHHDLIKSLGQGFVGDFMGVQIHKSAYVPSDGTDRSGAMFSAGAIAYALGTPVPLAAPSGEIRPAGTPVLVELERDSAFSLTKVVGTAYTGAAICEQTRIVELLSDA